MMSMSAVTAADCLSNDAFFNRNVKPSYVSLSCADISPHSEWVLTMVFIFYLTQRANAQHMCFDLFMLNLI